MQVYRAQSAFDTYRTAILLVTFGHAQWAEAWRRETGVTFPILFDPERDLYHRYGLIHSISHTYRPRTAWFYVKKALRGQFVRAPRGDPHQLGGNVVIAPDGRIAFIHRSREPVDRPSVEQLLEVIARSTAE